MLSFRDPTHFINPINFYVPKMTGFAGMGTDGEYICDQGTPANALATGILSAVAVGATYTVANFATSAGFNGPKGLLDAPYGRQLTMIASGAGTNVVTFSGFDYLNQPITKAFALNGAANVDITTTFKRLVSVVIAAGGAITVNVGYSNVLGLPFKTSVVLQEFADGVRSTTVTTITPPVVTDPATNATGDPRGTYLPVNTPDGVKRFHLQALANTWYNAAGNGGLHGIRHFA